MKNKTTVKNMIFISFGAVLLSIGGWLTIPFVVPFTMQTFVLYFLLDFLGAKSGFLSILLYISLGLVGIPVFSGFNSGISVLLGPTGGFVIGFFVVGGVYFALKSIFAHFLWVRWVLPFASLWLCYGCGVLWYMFYLSQPIGLTYSFTVCVLPYIIPDCIKIVLALLLSKRLKKSFQFNAYFSAV